MLATCKWLCYKWSAVSEPIIANHSTYIAYILYGTTDHLKGLFHENYYMYVRISTCCISFNYMCVIYFIRVYTCGLVPRVFLSLLCTCDTRVPSKLWVICTVDQ